MGLNMKKCVMFTTRGCFLCVLTFICRSSPFMFSLLVYVSPVLVCTAVLLGTLLFFGQQNAPRIEMKERTTHETVSKDSIVVENNNNNKSRYGEKQKDNDICREDNKKRTRETRSDNSGEFHEKHKDDERFSEKKGMENHVDDILESEYEKSEAESYDSEMVNMDSFESQSHSAWKRVKHGGDDDEEEEEAAAAALDSEFDGSESSSPDASMPDMIPMLDELHPLLDEEATQLVQTSSRAVSEAPSEKSPPSSIESIDETENPEDSEVPDDDEDAHNDKEDQAAIVWTEEDKRNLMDVGSSEIERNKRLESLILRRRSWKNRMSMVPEINLIDLESSEFPYHMMHISTTRHNPFELPHDSDSNSGLPPVPSSAPPILLPRRNPVEVPFQPSEEKPNVMEEAFLRSNYDPERQLDLKWRPYFVPEVAMVSGEASYPTLRRASSESESESESSVAETESVSSVEVEQEDKELSEEDAPLPSCVTHGSQSSEGEECLELGNSSGDQALEDRRHSRQSSVSSEQPDTSGHVPNKEPVYDLSPTADQDVPILERVRTTDIASPNSDEDYVEANDKLISTPSAGGSTPHFHDRLLHETEFKQVQVPNSPVGDLNLESDKEADDQMKEIGSIIHQAGSQLLSKHVCSTLFDTEKEKSISKNSITSSIDESTSSDSKGNKQVMISVKRRLSTPF